MKKSLSLALIAALGGAGLTLALDPSPAAPTHAQDDDAAEQEARARLESKARRAIEISGGATQGKAMIDQMMASFAGLPGLPAGFTEKFAEMVKPGDLVDLTVPIWAKHLTETDIDALIAYYESAPGQAFLKAQPAIAQESMMAGQKWGQGMAMKVMQELQRDDD